MYLASSNEQSLFQFHILLKVSPDGLGSRLCNHKIEIPALDFAKNGYIQNQDP